MKPGPMLFSHVSDCPASTALHGYGLDYCADLKKELESESVFYNLMWWEDCRKNRLWVVYFLL